MKTNIMILTFILLPLAADFIVLAFGQLLRGKRIQVILASFLYIVITICLPLYAATVFEPQHILEGILSIIIFRAIYAYGSIYVLFQSWKWNQPTPTPNQSSQLSELQLWAPQHIRVILLLLVVMGIGCLWLLMRDLITIVDKGLIDSIAIFLLLTLFGILSIMIERIRAQQINSPQKERSFISRWLAAILCFVGALIFLLIAIHLW